MNGVELEWWEKEDEFAWLNDDWKPGQIYSENKQL